MTDSEIAKKNLEGHTLSLCRDGVCLTSDKRGIAPMLDFIARGYDLSGFSLADLVVGKAAVLLFAKAGIACVHAEVLSEGGRETLEKFKIPYTFDCIAKNIVNRDGTDICPMEKTDEKIDDFEEGYEALVRKVAQMKR